MNDQNISQLSEAAQVAMVNNEFWLDIGSGASGLIFMVTMLFFFYKMATIL